MNFFEYQIKITEKLLIQQLFKNNFIKIYQGNEINRQKNYQFQIIIDK